MKTGEFRKFRNTAIALMAAVGASALAPDISLGKSTKCDVPGAVSKIKRHVRKDDTFKWPAIRSSNPEDGFVLMTTKGDKPAQPAYNPLAIRCGGKTVRYVGVTIDPHNSLGRRHAVGGDTGLYLDVFKPGEVEIEKPYLKGHVVLVHPHLKEDVIHPIEQTNLPAFVQQPGPSTLENSFGVMSNGLILQ
jgi:hypothetical protein